MLASTVKSRLKVVEIMNELKGERHQVNQARLDYFISSTSLSYLVAILPGYRSDHYIVELELLNNFKKGKWVWKLNTSLLKNNKNIFSWETTLFIEKY